MYRHVTVGNINKVRKIVYHTLMHRVYSKLERYTQHHHQDKYLQHLKPEVVITARDANLIGSINGSGDQDFSSPNLLRRKSASQQKDDGSEDKIWRKS